MQLFVVHRDVVGNYIVENVEGIGLKIFVCSACHSGRDCQRLATYCFITLFLDYLAMSSYGFDCNMFGIM